MRTNSKILKDKSEKKSSSSYFGFYTYLTILIITVFIVNRNIEPYKKHHNSKASVY